MSSSFPLTQGQSGEAVGELQRRLAAVGILTDSIEEPGFFCRATGDALMKFQSQQGLPSDGSCDQNTWSALVEAAWVRGSRLLYFTSPQMRGGDVASLQHQLANLGFDCGRVDGILGPQSVHALTDFQTNYGLAPDGICGPETLRAFDRVIGHGGDGPGIVAVREYEELLRSDFFGAEGTTPRVVIATLRNKSPQLVHLAQQISRRLHSQSDQVIIIDHADFDAHIRTANTFDAHAYIGIDYGAGGDDAVAYYQTPTFVSQGGRSLAQRVAKELGELSKNEVQISGMRLPVLRETRMPAVICTIGVPTMLVERQKTYADALATATSVWFADIMGGSSKSTPVCLS